MLDLLAVFSSFLQSQLNEQIDDIATTVEASRCWIEK